MMHILARQGMCAIALSYGFKKALQLLKRAFQPFQGAQIILEKAKSQPPPPLSVPRF